MTEPNGSQEGTNLSRDNDTQDVTRRDWAKVLGALVGVGTLAGCAGQGSADDTIGSTALALTNGAIAVYKKALDLKSALPPAAGSSPQLAITLGYSAEGDGGGGTWAWAPNNSEPEDNVGLPAGSPGGTIIASTAAAAPPGRWKRIYSGPLNVKWFGAKVDGTTNDTYAIKAALSAAVTTVQVSAPDGGTGAETFGAEVFIPSGLCRCQQVPLPSLANDLAERGAGVRLFGAGISATVLQSLDPDAPIFQTNSTVFHLRLGHFTIKAHPSGSSGAAIYVGTPSGQAGVYSSTFEHIAYQSNGPSGDYAYMFLVGLGSQVYLNQFDNIVLWNGNQLGGPKVSILKCDNGGQGVLLNPNALTFTNWRIYGTLPATIVALDLFNSSHTEVHNCQFEWNTPNSTGTDVVPGNQCLVTGCYFEHISTNHKVLDIRTPIGTFGPHNGRWIGNYCQTQIVIPSGVSGWMFDNPNGQVPGYFPSVVDHSSGNLAVQGNRFDSRVLITPSITATDDGVNSLQAWGPSKLNGPLTLAQTGAQSGRAEIALAANATGQGGAYIEALAGAFILSNQAEYNGSGFIARATTAQFFNINTNGAFYFFSDSGLTSGNAYTPTTRFNVNGQGVPGFCGVTAPASQPTVTGSTGGNAALQSVLSALASLGLIRNNAT